MTYKSENPDNATYENLLGRLNRVDLKRDAFFLLYARLIEIRFRDSKVSFTAEDAIQVEWDNGRKTEVFLSNMAVECERDLESRKSVVERYLLTLEFDRTSEVRGSRGNIVPIIKDSTYREYLRDQAPFVSDHLAGDLWIIYAVDLPESTISLTRDQMNSLEVSKEEIRSICLDNLRRILPEVECHQEGTFFRITAGEIYVASVLLLDSVWEFVAKMVDGDLLAVAPSRDVVLFTGSRSREGILAMREKANEIFKVGHHVISTTILRLNGMKWSTYE